MKNDFKEKLEKFDRGDMSEEEKQEFEKELEKQEASWFEPSLTKKRQKKILRAGKWKARISTALTAIPLLLLVLMISSFLTNFYYYGFSTGLSEKYNRSQRLSDVVVYSALITDPYAEKYPSDTKVGMFFNMDVKRDLKKIVGKESFVTGQMNVNFLFSKMGIANKSYFGKEDNLPEFRHPSWLSENETNSDNEWERLDKLPEGTVTTAFVSFKQLMSTDDVFEAFTEKDMDLLWFPVHTPQAENMDFAVFNIGFPNYPLFHHDDWSLESRTEERSLFGSSVSETRSAPNYVEGDTEMLHEHFIKTIDFLKDYQKEFNELQVIHGFQQLEEIASYLNENNITHHGVVLTGPTKKVLALKEEAFVSSIIIDEVALWNWHNE